MRSHVINEKSSNRRRLPMQSISINRSRVVFVNLTEMDYYNGLEANLKGGGRFVEQHGYGYEIFNFQRDNGKCFGYTPPYGKINLSRISDNINHDAFSEYIDDVCVVFTCSRELIGRIVCGVYQHARVYAESIKDNRNTRIIKTAEQNEFAYYNIICNAEDAILINRSDRSKCLPHSKSNNGIGHGQNSVWYVDESTREKLRDDLLDYLEKLINQAYLDDEYKYHLHDESRTRIVSTKQIYRSQNAKNECIRLKGCYCNICGFDFEKTYGELGKKYIEVHHITPIGKLSTAEGYDGTDPQNDLIPLCSNCHSMIHRRKEPYLPDEIKAMLCMKIEK
jgi:5-methylcytosine-specific restriction protein A